MRISDWSSDVCSSDLEDGAGSATGIWPLAVEDLRFAPGGKPLIDGITLQLSPGTRSIVMGPNGAGKSLFLRLLAGLLQPTAGRVTYGGRAADPAALRGRKSVVVGTGWAVRVDL